MPGLVPGISLREAMRCLMIGMIGMTGPSPAMTNMTKSDDN